MSTNPWAAPADEVRPSFRDTLPRDPWNLPWLLFGFQGRISRAGFWGGTMLATLGFYAGFLALAFIAGADDALLTIGVLVLYVPLIWTTVAIQAKRWHDLGKSGWWVLVGLVPVGGLFSLLMCGLIAGNTGPNAYGPAPK